MLLNPPVLQRNYTYYTPFSAANYLHNCGGIDIHDVDWTGDQNDWFAVWNGGATSGASLTTAKSDWFYEVYGSSEILSVHGNGIKSNWGTAGYVGFRAKVAYIATITATGYTNLIGLMNLTYDNTGNYDWAACFNLYDSTLYRVEWYEAKLSSYTPNPLNWAKPSYWNNTSYHTQYHYSGLTATGFDITQSHLYEIEIEGWGDQYGLVWSMACKWFIDGGIIQSAYAKNTNSAKLRTDFLRPMIGIATPGSCRLRLWGFNIGEI